MVNYTKYKKILLGLIFLAGWGWGKSLHAEGFFVKEVRIEGASKVSEFTIRSHLKTKPGLIVDRADIDADVRHLFKLGFFKDIQVDRQRADNGWIYTFFLTEKGVVSKIEIEGNKKIKDPALREVITLPLYQPINEQKIAESIEAMRELYAKKNYYLADIRYRLRTGPTGEQEFVFVIKEHSRALIRRVQFLGNTVFGDEELSKVIKTRRKGAFSWVTGSGKYNEEELKHDILRLTFHYLKNGYLKVRVDPPQITLTKDKHYFFVTFHIQEGDRYRIGKVDIEGDILTTREELVADLLTQKEDIYNREYVERDMQSLTKKYADQGYAFVNVRPLTVTDEVAKTADIAFHITKGNRITIEKINISGNTVTRDKVIRREMRLKEGDLYNETKLQESRERIMALGYFKDVNFATPRGSNDEALNLDLTVEERPTGSFSVGAGFSTTENFVLTGSLQKQNFFGLGWSGEISGEFSSRRQQFLFSMIDPYLLDTEWILGTSAHRTVFRFNDFDRESYGGSFSIGHRFFDHSSVSIGYQAEQVSATDFASFVPQRFVNSSSGLTSLLSLTINNDTRDNRLFANKGMFHSVKLEVSGSKLGGDNDFLRVTGRSQFFQPLGKGFNFKTYGRVGHIQNLGIGVIPLFERFFAGGVNSLRGYYPDSVGPVEPTTNSEGKAINFVFGGDKMIIMNFEIEYPIYEPAGLKVVTFFDAGNAFGEGSALAFNRLRTDYGFGLRWISPMGPLRFEWGFPIHRKAGEQKSVFNFTIGSFF